MKRIKIFAISALLILTTNANAEISKISINKEIERNINTEIVKINKKLRKELKERTNITIKKASKNIYKNKI
jgi:multisubunit Na+/H+ antiporter MnhE subunit